MSQIRVVTSNFETDFEFSIAKKHLQPGSSQAKQSANVHCHENFELEFIHSGEGFVLINDEKYAVRRGSAYLITPSDLHAVQLEGCELWLYSLRFNANILADNFLQELFFIQSAFITDFPEELSQMLCNLLDKITGEYDSQNTYRKELIRLLFSELIVYFLRQIPKENRKPGVSKSAPILIHRICAYIKYNFNAETLSVNTLAKHFYLSPNYLGAFFKKETGVSCTAYIKNLRLQFGRSLILNTKLSIGEITDKCGFSSSAYFTKEFRKKYGIPPAALRKNPQKAAEEQTLIQH